MTTYIKHSYLDNEPVELYYVSASLLVVVNVN